MTSRRAAAVSVAVLAAGLWASGTSAQSSLYIYPKGGQSKELMSKDKGECNQWAIEQTGFDPARPDAPIAPPPQQTGPDGSAVRGAAKGAALGAIGGAIAGDAGKGAAVGAGVGGAAGVLGKRGQERQNQQQYQQAQANQQAQRQAHQGEWSRAYTVCLEGRNYTVK
ncbi:MAG: hypothetical protein IPK07_31620 [Deltaproteobacteria bacterium]|nr:hypothetical protein [Deltaproteobacteria bacterium]